MKKKSDKQKIKELVKELDLVNTQYSRLQSEFNSLYEDLLNEKASRKKQQEIWSRQEDEMLDSIFSWKRRFAVSEQTNTNLIKVIERLGEDIGENQAEYENLRRHSSSARAEQLEGITYGEISNRNR